MKDVLASVWRPNASSALSKYSGIPEIGSRIVFDGVRTGSAGSKISLDVQVSISLAGVLGREGGGLMNLIDGFDLYTISMKKY